MRSNPRIPLALAAAVLGLVVLAASVEAAGECPSTPAAVSPEPVRPASGLVVTIPPAGGSMRAAVRADGQAVARKAEQLRRLAAVLPGRGVRLEPELGAVKLELPEALDELPVARAAQHVGRILERVAPNARVEPDGRAELRREPNDFGYQMRDPRAPQTARGQWNLRRQGFPRVWRRTDGRRSRIAVIDSGVDANHPDLQRRIRRSFAIGTGSPGIDTDGHGTHVAGMACAHGNNRIGVAGAAYRCQLLTYKIDLSFSAIAQAIRDAAQRNVDVINMSLGGDGDSQLLRRAINFAYQRDVLMVASADNRPTSDQGIPARYLQPTGTARHIKRGRGLVVTAAGYDGRPAYFNPGQGSQISIAAFGAATAQTQGLLSTFPGNRTSYDPTIFNPTGCGCRVRLEGDDRYAYLEGTSMSAPQVAGLGALFRSIWPRISPRVVMRAIKRTGASRGGDGWSPRLGWGVIRADRAIARAHRARARARSRDL